MGNKFIFRASGEGGYVTNLFKKIFSYFRIEGLSKITHGIAMISYGGMCLLTERK